MSPKENWEKYDKQAEDKEEEKIVGDIALLKTYGQGPYAKELKKIDSDIKDVQKRINEKIGVKESDTGLAPPNLWDIPADKQRMQEEQPLQVARCTKIIEAGEGEEAKYIINVKQIAKFVVALGERVSPTDIEEGMRVGVDRNKYQIQIPLPPKIDPSVTMMQVEEKPDVTYSDVGGCKEQIEKLREVVELPLLQPERFVNLGIDPPKGVLLYGPPGTGKTLCARAVANRTDATFIRVIGSELVQKYVGEGARMVRELVLKLAKQVGYFPVFSTLVSMSNLIDGLASATIGQKTGFSSTTDSEIKKILDALAIALHDVAPEKLRKSTRYNQKKKHDFITTSIVESYDPADIPIVVIDDYMIKDKENHELWDHLAKLAAILVENRVAHVVFVGSNVGIVKHLNKALPNKTFNFVNLSDAPYERAISLVKSHVPDKEDKGLDGAVNALGGRLTDLKLFINKISSGQSSQDAKTIPWSGIQFWKIVKDLAKGEPVPYDKIKYSSIFKGDDTSIRAMEQAELISVSQLDGRPDFIRLGKPLYQVAFQQIISDKLFAATMELQTYKYLFEFETDKIKKYEQELESLGQLFVKQEGKWLFGSGRVPAIVDQRVKFLLELVQKSHVRTVDYEKNIEELKKFIASGGTS
ncbi:6926_t:CDS:10 [Entrophospora sp. SA101]|nr:6926_t:CDS:10 [Entrophospora sp. SA101]CAJ0843552.1 6310_t:CDS:10 [Entrophospora sp. SA101]